MSLSGEDKEIRMQTFSSAAYTTTATNNSVDNPPEKPRSASDLNSGGSKLCKPSNPRISYRECLRNHAANMGGNVTDGCGEFMPGGDDGSLEALKCAACNCHRNFHRKEIHGEAAAALVVHPLHLPPPLPSPSMSHHRGGSAAPHWGGTMLHPMKMAFGNSGGGSAGTDSSSEELNFHPPFHPNAAGVTQPPPHFTTKKRFRTKFTAEQKEKMLAFAEKCGWRIPREDDAEVQRFCAEVGVKRQVFKVWMHNNKITSAKKTSAAPDEF